jgi:uncharacterized membrane protein YfcA
MNLCEDEGDCYKCKKSRIASGLFYSICKEKNYFFFLAAAFLGAAFFAAFLGAAFLAAFFGAAFLAAFFAVAMFLEFNC